MLSQKDEAAQSSRESLLAEKPRHVTETTTDCSDGNGDHSVSGLNSLSDDTGLVSSFTSMQPVIEVTRLMMRTDAQQQEEQTDPTPTPQDLTSTSATSSDSTDQNVNLHGEEAVEVEEEEETTAQASVVEEPDSEAAAAVEEEEEAAPALPGKKSSMGRAKPAPKRRSGRANRR